MHLVCMRFETIGTFCHLIWFRNIFEHLAILTFDIVKNLSEHQVILTSFKYFSCPIFFGTNVPKYLFENIENNLPRKDLSNFEIFWEKNIQNN